MSQESARSRNKSGRPQRTRARFFFRPSLSMNASTFSSVRLLLRQHDKNARACETQQQRLEWSSPPHPPACQALLTTVCAPPPSACWMVPTIKRRVPPMTPWGPLHERVFALSTSSPLKTLGDVQESNGTSYHKPVLQPRRLLTDGDMLQERITPHPLKRKLLEVHDIATDVLSPPYRNKFDHDVGMILERAYPSQFSSSSEKQLS